MTKIRQDYKISFEPEITKHPEKLWKSSVWCFVYALILVMSGIMFAIAILGG